MEFGRFDILDPEHLHLLLPHAPLRTEETPPEYSEEPDPPPARQPSPFPSLRDTHSLPMSLLSSSSSRSESRSSPGEASAAGRRGASIVVDGLDIGGGGSRVVSWGAQGDHGGGHEDGSGAEGGEEGEAKTDGDEAASTEKPISGCAGKGEGEDDDDDDEGDVDGGDDGKGSGTIDDLGR